MIVQTSWLLIAALATTTWAQIQFSKPASGAPATLKDGGLVIEWYSAGVEDLKDYRIELWAGGQSEDTAGQVAALSKVIPTAADGASSASLPLSKDAGPLATNGYFLKMLVTTVDGADAAFYSDRFSIAGMTGQFPESDSGKSPAQVAEAYRKVKSDITAVPNSFDRRQVAPAAPVVPGAAAAGGAPAYSLQTAGAIKTAPMQQLPGTTITAQNTDPMYPTTAYVLATTALPIPVFITTQTVARTWSTSSIENQATAAIPPADDMAKYLARWRD